MGLLTQHGARDRNSALAPRAQGTKRGAQQLDSSEHMSGDVDEGDVRRRLPDGRRAPGEDGGARVSPVGAPAAAKAVIVRILDRRVGV